MCESPKYAVGGFSRRKPDYNSQVCRPLHTHYTSQYGVSILLLYQSHWRPQSNHYMSRVLTLLDIHKTTRVWGNLCSHFYIHVWGRLYSHYGSQVSRRLYNHCSRQL